MKLSNVFSRRNRILLRELVVTDFKLRYQGSFLGYLWSVLKPLFLFAILYVVFAKFLKLGAGIQHYPVYLLFGIVLWTFFTEATTIGLQSIVARGDLIRKINFPKYIIVLSGTISSLINLAINLAVVLVFAIFNHVDFSFSSFLVLPFILELYIFSLALALFLAALNVKLRDVGYIWEILLQALFYATPIIYPIATVIVKSKLIAGVILLSPIAQIIQDARYYFVSNTTVTLHSLYSNPWVNLIPYVIVVALIIISSFFFKARSKKFAEEL